MREGLPAIVGTPLGVVDLVDLVDLTGTVPTMPWAWTEVHANPARNSVASLSALPSPVTCAVISCRSHVSPSRTFGGVLEDQTRVAAGRAGASTGACVLAGNPAIRGATHARGPEALRPCLATGLPLNRRAGVFNSCAAGTISRR